MYALIGVSLLIVSWVFGSPAIDGWRQNGWNSTVVVPCGKSVGAICERSVAVTFTYALFLAVAGVTFEAIALFRLRRR